MGKKQQVGVADQGASQAAKFNLLDTKAPPAQVLVAIKPLCVCHGHIPVGQPSNMANKGRCRNNEVTCSACIVALSAQLDIALQAQLHK